MWITTYHRFHDRAAFIAACAMAGWKCPAHQDPELPRGVAMDQIGPLIGAPRVGQDGLLEKGDVLDEGYHVKLAWHDQAPDPAFLRSQCAPPIAARSWAAFPTGGAAETAVPAPRGKAIPVRKPVPGLSRAAAPIA